ncbi:MAG: [protein-PII] uridylyltransferase [Geobacteraceae bacterium]|nr:[protein-PII] uridylyltransferase [Geobacteraceae bacterium]
MNFDVNRYFPDEVQEMGDSGRATFEEKRPLYLAAGRHFLNNYGSVIRDRHDAGAGGDWVVHSISEMMDTLIRKLFHSIAIDMKLRSRAKEQITLVATGGYGRGELNPHSDIDLMFLYGGKEGRLVEEIAQKILYFLWDMRLDVGYSVRTVSDCIEISASDSTVKTALLDIRHICGDRALFKELVKIVLTRIMTNGSDAFIRQKVMDLNTRREKYGSSVYLLEPNIKEGEGGLRDLQTALWIAKVKFKVSDPRELVVKGVMSEEELNLYNGLLTYLWRIRNYLHYMTGRKNDQLTFADQSAIAAFLGYRDNAGILGVEEFLRDYYLNATKVEQFWSFMVSRCLQLDEGRQRLGFLIRRHIGEGFYVIRGELVVPDESIIAQDPSRIMKLFEYAQKHGVELSVQARDLVRKSLYLVNDRFRRNRDVNSSFFAILRSQKGVAETLRLMHYLGLLIRFIPEFERVYCKAQHDLYHIYTVDVHSLFAVEEIIKLWNGVHRETRPLLTRLASEVGKRGLLLLAALLHDVGKGEGGNHAEKGAEMMPTIGRRLGLSKEDSERLQFLVRNHLLFAHIAQRRDLHDEKMIIQFARQMGKSENLNMLYLLTYADLKAVGPDVWTEWKAMLMEELYEKTFAVLERGDFKYEVKSEKVKNIRKKILEIIANEYPVSVVKEELKALSTRHLLSNNPDEIAGHVRMLLSLGVSPIVSSVNHELESGYSKFTVCTFDVPGLFSMITGVMAANGMNILGAQINTSTNGKILDVLQINSPQGFVITDDARWRRVEKDLGAVIQGTIRVGTLVEKRHRPTLLMEKVKPRFPTVIDIDNEVSDDYTVIDIYTHDKVGLLYDITSTLTDLGLYIGVSKISTKIDQVADVFYVKDIFGQKITFEDKLAEIRKRLLAVIDGETDSAMSEEVRT